MVSTMRTCQTRTIPIMLTQRDEDEVCNSADPYSTLPTLLDLQHMKNRLNVAQVGKELMEWHSDSTGLELKKISANLQSVYKNFGRDMREAFLLLARCRYFNEDFYRTITENVKMASLHVECSCTTVAGVNIINYTTIEIPNVKVCKCPFLCRGGQAIQEAKKAWTELLKSHIKMVELRTNFLSLESAHKNATKRLNIISQIVLPKTQATINYILIELEEVTREESHRIKIKSSKIRNGPKKNCSCTENVYCFLHKRNKREDKKTVTTKGNLASVNDILQSSPYIYDAKAKLMKRTSDQPTPPLKDMLSELIAVHEPNSTIKHKIDSLKNFYEFVSTETNNSSKRLSLGDFDPRNDIKNVYEAENQMDELLSACQYANNLLKKFNSNEKSSQVETELKLGLNRLKSRIDAVIKANIRLQNSAFISPDVIKFIKGCEEVDYDLKRGIKDIYSMPLDKSGKKRIEYLIKHIDDIVKCITSFRSEGLLTPSLEEFSKACTETKAEIGGYNVNDLQRIECLKGYISDLESITTDVTSEGVKTTSIEKFLSSCRGIKIKLDEHKQRRKRPSYEFKKTKVKVKQEEEKEVTVTTSVQKFIKSCEDVIKCFQKHEYSTSKIFKSVYDNNILRIAKLMSNLQSQGLLSKSTIAFLRGSERKKGRVDKYNDESNDTDSTSYPMSITGCELSSFHTDTGERNSTALSTDSSITFTILEEKEDKILDSSDQDSKIDVSKPMQAEKDQYSKEGKQFSSEVKHAENYENLENSAQDSFDSSERHSDVIVAEISTYNSCPGFDSRESNSCDTLSSDSWTKPLIPKPNYCMMCMSNISTDSSSNRQICKICERTHRREDIIRTIPKTYTV